VARLAFETGWPESFILEELPLARFLIYQHVILRDAGHWTVPVVDAGSIDKEAQILGLL
jgi:hypothetical protein